MARSRYKDLVDRFAADIRSGRLRPGTRLPTHRKLASKEGLALVTASRVYAELEAMGLTSGEAGRGTFVREFALPRAHGVDQMVAASDVVDLVFNYPSLPDQAAMLRRALGRLSVSGDIETLLRYQAHGGRTRDRESVAKHLLARGLNVPPRRLLLVDGAQHGLTVTAMALLQPGDVVAVDALTYPGFKLVAEAFRLELLPLPAAGQGPDLNALEDLCKRRAVRAVYMMPTLHNPLGWVMSAKRRHALVALARRHDLLLIEDAAYAFLVEDSPPPLAALAPDITVYVSSVSKSVATGLRVGFIAAPEESVPRLERAIRATTWNAPAVMTGIVSGWMEDGTVSLLEAAKRKDGTMRQALAKEHLHPLQPLGHSASYFCWLPLTEGARADAVAMALLQEGISVSTAEPFCTTPTRPHALRLALGSVEADSLVEALGTVRRIVMDQMSVA